MQSLFRRGSKVDRVEKGREADIAEDRGEGPI